MTTYTALPRHIESTRTKDTALQEATWQAVSDVQPEFWDDPQAPVTADLVYAVTAEVLENVEYDQAPARLRRRVRVWLLEPDRYSPHVDEVAVNRALNENPKMWYGLTDREREVMVTVILDAGWDQWRYGRPGSPADVHREFQVKVRESEVHPSRQAWGDDLELVSAALRARVRGKKAGSVA